MDSDFGFAFNNSNFSDRDLRIEIVPDLPGTKSESEGCSSIAEWARDRKRMRGEIKKENGDEMVQGNDSSRSRDGSTVLRVKMIHISSPILAAKSPFFYKLFSNGMKDSDQRHITLRIHASALLYLDLPSTLLMAQAVQPLTEMAKQFLAGSFKDITKFKEEVMSLPLVGIEALLSSDELQVASEDAVYDFMLKWARTHYLKLEERREILGTRLARLIRFPYMTCRKLKKVLTCNDFDPEIASKVVLEALFFKAEAPYWRCSIAAEEANASYRRFGERAYKYRPVKVVKFELPCHQCVVYLDLTLGECVQLFPDGRVNSQAFYLAGQGFFLSAQCNVDQQSSYHCFGLFLGMHERGSATFPVDYEFAARSKLTEGYVSKYKGNYAFTGGKVVGCQDLFGKPFIAFVGSPSFINGILHLRAELTIRQ